MVQQTDCDFESGNTSDGEQVSTDLEITAASDEQLENEVWCL